MVEKSKKVLDKKDTKVKKISNNKKRVKKEIKTEEPKKEKLILDEEFINKNVNFSLLEVIIIILVTGIVVSLSTGLIVYNNYDKISKSKSDDTSSEIKEFTESYNHIINSYIDEVDKSKLIDAAISGMYNFLNDEYSIYMDNDMTESLNEQLEGTYDGIGIEMTMNNKGVIYVTQVFKNTPAEKAGLKPDDILVALDGESLEGKTTAEVASVIKKGTKSEFKLTYKRDNIEKTVTVNKKHIYINSVKSEIFDNIGYINISTFSATTEEQVKKELDNFDKNISNLIIDLRNNTGGYLNAAYDVSELFLKKGKVIYQLKDRNNKITKFTAKSGEYRHFNNIIVIINGSTASASEILALALKESANAKIVGTKSYGKGTVQETSKLKSGSMVKYTTAYWLSPEGNSINKTGITPDYKIDGEEGQLKKAIEIAK
ncbi:MAG: S41 family peptidase [Clostridium sp.]|nr:S41 family peptidase [Clostridium sp.]